MRAYYTAIGSGCTALPCGYKRSQTGKTKAPDAIRRQRISFFDVRQDWADRRERGAGHQAGISHAGGGFMAEGNYINDVLINNPKNPTKSIYDLITCHERANEYFEKMRKRFQPNNQSPKVNYSKK